MKRNRSVGVGCLAVLVAFGLAAPVSADTVTWANSPGNTDWMSGASWVDGNVPGVDDVAVFPDPTVAPVAQPTLNGTTNINALLMVHWGSGRDWILSGSGTLTLGGTPGTAAGHGLEIQSYNPRLYPNLVLGGPQSWALTVSSGGPDVYLYGTLSGTGPLTIQQPISTWGYNRWYFENAAAPTFTGGLNVTCGKMQWNLLLQGADRTESFGLDAAGTAPGTITLNYGGGFGFNTTSDGVNQPVLTLSNPFVVGAGTGFVGSYQGGASSKYSRNVFTGPIALNGILGLDTTGSGSAARFTGTITLDRGVASVGGIYVVPFPTRSATLDINDDSCNLDRNIEGNIVESGAGFTKPLVLRARNGGQTYIMGAANTYAGGTVVEFCGDTYRNSSQNATISVDAASKLGTGDVLVLPAGKLRLAADTNIEAGRALRVRSDRANAAVVAVRSVFVPTALTDDSAGIFAIDCTYDTPLDMSTVGNGTMFLGSVYSRTYSAPTLAPCADGVYRLGGGVAGNNSWPSLDVTQASLGDVGGASALLVGQNAHNGMGRVILRRASTFSGDITVTGVKMYHDFPSASELTGYAQAGAGQSPFGAGTGGVRLRSGDLYLYGVYGGQPVAKGALSFEGQCRVTVDSDYATQLTFDSLSRANNGVLLFRYVKNTGNEKLFITNPTPTPFVTNGICRPYILCANATDFATYGADGLAAYAGYATSLPSPGTGTEVVKWSGAVAASSDLWALRTTGALSGTGTLTIRGGGLILGGSIGSTVDIDFGTAEGVIYSPANATLYGKISGSGGLTFAGGQQTMLDNVNNDFTGTITINANAPGWVRTAARFDTDAGAIHGALGHADNDILLNGGSLRRESSGDCLLATRTITLGPLGGDLESGTDVTVYGPIVGEGFLHLREGNVAFDSAANTYSGGTRVRGNLTVNANSSVGTGEVTVNYGTVTFLGDDNMSTGARLTVCADVKPHTRNVEQEGRARAYFQSAAPHIGSLVGSGEVRLGATGVDTVLTVGEDDTDFAYFGSLRQLAGRTCGVTKAGSGTWTLYGAHSYTGPTTVDGGSLRLCGSLAGDLAVGSAGGLTVDIGPDGATCGTVAGTVELGGTLTVNVAEGYAPAGGESWTILGGASAYTGDFDAVSAPGFRAKAADGNLNLTWHSAALILLVR